MKRKMFGFRTVVAALACCVASTAFARLIPALFTVAIPNVNVNGTLDFGHTHNFPFVATINTNTGNFVGTARGLVLNKSLLPHFYPNPGLSITGKSTALAVANDALTVAANGSASYIANGSVAE